MICSPRTGMTSRDSWRTWLIRAAGEEEDAGPAGGAEVAHALALATSGRTVGAGMGTTEAVAEDMVVATAAGKTRSGKARGVGGVLDMLISHVHRTIFLSHADMATRGAVVAMAAGEVEGE